MGKNKPKVPGRVPDETFSLAALKKLREELEEIQSLPSPATAPNAHGAQTATGGRRRDADDAHAARGIFGAFVRDFTQSKYDEKRRRRGPDDFDVIHTRKKLMSTGRYRKLNDESQLRANPDFIEQQAELVQKHGAWFRTKLEQDKAKERQKEKEQGIVSQPRKKQAQKANPLVSQLKELQKELQTGEKEKIQGLKASMQFGKNLSKDEIEFDERVTDKAVFSFLEWALQQFGTLQAAFMAIDVNNNNTVSRHEFVQACRKKHFRGNAHDVYDVLESSMHGDKHREISLKEFVSLKPYLEEFLNDLEEKHTTESSWQPTIDDSVSPDSSPTARARASTIGSSSSAPFIPSFMMAQRVPGAQLIEKYHMMQKERKNLELEAAARRIQAEKQKYVPTSGLPQTFSLMIFRNADRHHTGRPLFLRKPPSSLAKLFEVCDDIVPPVIGTVKALLDQNLRPLKALEDLQDGAMLLAKGPERHLIPPPAFWDGNGKRRTNTAPSAPMSISQQMGIASPGSHDIRSTTASSSSVALSRSVTPLSRTVTPAWSPSKKSMKEVQERHSAMKGMEPVDPRPLILFQNVSNPDRASRTRDREWRVYEGALGNIIGDPHYLEDAGLMHQLRSVQSTPELQNSTPPLPLPLPMANGEAQPSKVDKATITSWPAELEWGWNSYEPVPMQQIDNEMYFQEDGYPAF